MTIGQRLKKARKIRNMTQNDLADKIGASRGVITNIEHDKIEFPQPMVVNAICSVLKINKEWLLENIGNMDETVTYSTDTLSEIYIYIQELSEKEQLFVLDILKKYINNYKIQHDTTT